MPFKVISTFSPDIHIVQWCVNRLCDFGRWKPIIWNITVKLF